MKTEILKESNFVNFLNRAYKLDKRIKRPSSGEYKSLKRDEVNGKSQKKLNELKQRIEKCIQIFLKNSTDYSIRESLNVLSSLNAQAKDSSDMDSVISMGLKFTKSFM